MSTASKVAQAKIDHPEDFCPHPRCLWRTFGGRCIRHGGQKEDMHGRQGRAVRDIGVRIDSGVERSATADDVLI